MSVFLARRWRRQPQGPLRFDSGLMRPTAVWLPSPVGMFDTVGNAHAFARGVSNLSTMVASSNGYVLRGDNPVVNGVSGYETRTGVMDLVGKTAVTMFAVVTFHPSALFRNAETIIIRTDDDNNINSAQLSLGVFPSIKTIRPLAQNMAWTTSNDTAVADAFEASVPYLIVGHIKAGEYVRAGAAKIGGRWAGLVNNQASFVAGASIIDGAANQQTHIGGAAYNYTGWWGDVLMAGILPYSEKNNSLWQEITTNPWQLFKPQQSVLISLPSGNLFTAIDETVADRSDFILATARNSVYETTLSPITKPADGSDIVVNFDASSPADTGSIKFDVLSGSTVIKSQTVSLATNVGSLYLPRRWRQQPQRPVQLDWTNPLTAAIDNCILITSNGISNPVNPSLQPSGALYVAGSPLGIGTEPITSPVTTVALPVASNKTWTKASFFAYGFVTNKLPYPSNSAPQIFGTRSFSAGKVSYDSAGENVAFGFTTGNFEYPGLETVAAGYATGILRPGFPVSLGAVFSTGFRQCAFYANGKYLGYQQGGTWDTVVAPMRNPGDGTGLFMNSYTGIVLSFSATWSRVLSAAEFAALDENPWQIFKPLTRRIVSTPRTVETSFNITPAEHAVIDSQRYGKFLPQRWRKQPQGNVEIDSTNSITKYLSVVASPWNRLMPFTRTNPTSYNLFAASAGMGPSIFRGGKHGVGAVDANNTGNYSWQTLYCIVGADQSLTVANVGEMIGPNDGSLVGTMGATWGSGNLYVYRSASAFEAKSLILGGANPAVTESLLGANIGAGPIVQTGVFTNASPISVSVGRLFFSSASNWTAGGANNFVSSANFACYGPFIQFYTAVWTRKLSQDERLSLNENPWQIFRPNPGRLYGLPPAGGWPWTPKLRVTSL